MNDAQKVGLLIGGLLIAILFLSCSSTLATYDENGTKVITKTVYVPSYYPVQYNSFYNPGGLGYYNNFYRPIYRPYRARPIVRTRTVRPARRVVKPAPRRVVRPVRSVRPTITRTTGNTLTRVNKGRRQ